jgi:dCMP deaminase
MQIAIATAARSTCNRAIVGCLLTINNRVLTTGFNGSVKKQDHCDEHGHLMLNEHCIRTIHAEANAIIQAALNGVSTDGATAYVTHFPCVNCSKMFINAGIKRLVYIADYKVDHYAVEFLTKADIDICQILLESKIS